jgi:hypothetical protein
MASLLVVMPVLPSTTVSAALNLRGNAGNALADRAQPRDPIQAAPTPQVAPMMKSLRFTVPPRRLLDTLFGRNGCLFRYQSRGTFLTISEHNFSKPKPMAFEIQVG